MGRPDLAADRPDRFEALYQSYYQAIFSYVLRRVPPDLDSVADLVAWDGLSHAEAAHVLGCSANAVALRVHKAKTIAPSTRAGWIRAGRPNFNKGPRRFTGPAPGFPLDNLSHLPTDPAVLKREIQQGKTGIEDLSADVDEPSTAGGTFWAALLLLTLPSYDGSAALRSALFKVMASVPGDKLIGRVRTRSGRSGIGILTPPFGRGETAVFKVIIDPSTGAILEYDEYGKQGFAEQWSEFLDAGVVRKIGQLPRG